MPTIRVSGRIRHGRNSPAAGFQVEASLSGRLGVQGPSAIVGTTTDQAGFFGLTLERTASADRDRSLDVHLEVKDPSGNRVLGTQGRENRTGRIDFQIMLEEPHVQSTEPDIYAGGFERLISRYIEMGETVDSSDQSVSRSIEYVVGVVRRWSVNRDELARECGLDATQVPRYPRSERHYHVTRWDEVVLKI